MMAMYIVLVAPVSVAIMCARILFSVFCRGGVEWTVGVTSTSAANQPEPRSLPPFQYPTGPSQATKNAKTPLQVFQLLLTSAILQSIVHQTKLFASQKNMDLHFCLEELEAFIGINIAMGLLRLPQVRDYWSTNEILGTPWFPAVMPRDHFLHILTYLHLVNSTQQRKKGDVAYDPLFKVRPLLNHLTAVFSKYYRPDRFLSIDEMMIGTRCRVAFLQYIPMKPTRFGIKAWVNAEAKSGYVLDLQIYTGAENDQMKKGLGLGYRVVMDLMEQYQGKGHCLFIDNFYTTSQLLIDLLAQGTYCTGTFRTNRKGFPMQLIPNMSMETGTFRFATAKHLLS